MLAQEHIPASRAWMLEGRVVIFVGAGSSPEKRSLYETAKKLGVRSVIIDGAGSWASCLVEDGTIDALYPVKFDKDNERTLDNMLAVVDRIRKTVGEPEAVVTFFEIAVPIATRLALALGLPANPISAVDNARDKHATRAVSAAAGLPTPRHASINSEADLEPAASTVSFPAVIKPIGMFQSMGVLRVNSFEELKAAYQTVLAELRAAQSASAGATDYRASVAHLGARMVLEEFLDGNEQVVDLVLSDGKCVYHSVTDNWAATRSFEVAQAKFNETGSNSPSMLTQTQQGELVDLGIKTALALGFRVGVLCLNMKYTSRGARLIEVNARMGGMFVRDHNNLCWGVDLVEEHLISSLGLPCHPPKAARPLRAAAGVYTSVEATGTVQDVAVLREYAALAHRGIGFEYFRPYVSVGDRVLGPADAADFPTWLCGYMLTAPSVEEAIALAQRVNDDVVARVPVVADA